MMGNLLESSNRSKRSIRSLLPSFVFHTVLIALAVYTTAKADTPEEKDSTVIHFVPIDALRSSTAPSPAEGSEGSPAPSPTEKVSEPSMSLTPPVPRIVINQIPTSVSAEIPIPEIGSISKVGLDFSSEPGGRGIGIHGPGDGRGRSTGSGPGSARDGSYNVMEVDQPALMDEKSPRPRYPEVLRTAHIQGNVIVQFVIDTLGRVEMKTVRILSSDNELFTSSVQNVLPKIKYYPATAAGKKVRQLATQPFTFSIEK